MTVHRTPGKVRLRLVLSAGWIKIATADTDETRVQVVALNDDPASAEAASQVREEFHQRAEGEYEVTVEAPDRGRRFLLFGRDPQLGFEITAPHTASVEASIASADISGTGRFQNVEVRSASGDVAFELLAGGATVKTASGDVRLQEVLGGADVKTSSGDVTVGKLSEHLRATLVSGDLEIDRLEGSTQASTVSGDIRVLDAGHGDLTLRSVSGDMVIAVQAGASVWMNVNSLSGATSSELEIGDPPQGGRAEIELRASSVSGDIRVTHGRDRAPADL